MALEELKIPKDIDGLDSRISALESDRGYLTPKEITNADDAIQNGIYKIKYDSLNLPEASSGVIEVTRYDASIVFQKITNALNNTWFRIRKSNEWSAWQQIATTDVVNGFKFYKGLGDINSSFTNQTDIPTICSSMANCSIALIDVGNNTNLYPANYGFVTIHKANDARCRLEFSTHSGNILAFATWHSTSGFSGWQQIATTNNTISNSPISLSRTESTTTQAIYTVSNDIVLGQMYCFGTGSSPSGTVTSIIFRTPQGDYTLKIADTNTVDTMSNATWGDFNAGTRVFVYFAERNSVKGAVITSPSYGYLNSKNVTTSTDDCTVNGKYYGSSSVLNLPESYSWVMDVIRYNDNFIYQKIHMGSGRIFFRFKTSSGWQPWQEIATTTKTPFSLTPMTGFTVLANDCYVINNIAYIKATIKKDSGYFTDSTVYAKSPYYKGITALSCFGAVYSSGVKGVGVQTYISTDGQIRCLTNTANFDTIYITGMVVL